MVPTVSSYCRWMIAALVIAKLDASNRDSQSICVCTFTQQLIYSNKSTLGNNLKLCICVYYARGDRRHASLICRSKRCTLGRSKSMVCKDVTDPHFQLFCILCS